MPGPSPAGLDATYSAVDIVMPIPMDVSGLTAELFGTTAATLNYPVIDVAAKIPVGGLFNGTAAWIHYIQDDVENAYKACVNQERATALHSDLSGALNLGVGAVYSKTSQASASALVPDVAAASTNKATPFDGGFGAAWEKYNSVQDMVISYFAIKILGHPGALAAISNDSSLRISTTAAVAAGLDQIYGEAAIALKEHSAGLTDFASKETVNGAGYTPVRVSGRTYLNEAQVLSVIEQMMNVDPARFATQDKNTWQPLRWFSNDKLRFHLRLSNNKFTVKTGGTNSLVAGGAAQNIGGTPAETANYQLVFTVA